MTSFLAVFDKIQSTVRQKHLQIDQNNHKENVILQEAALSFKDIRHLFEEAEGECLEIYP